MGTGSPVFQLRMKPDVRVQLEKAQDKIEAYSGEKMPLATIVRHALDEYIQYVLDADTDIDDLKDVPSIRRSIDSLSITDQNGKKLIEEFDFKEA